MNSISSHSNLCTRVSKYILNEAPKRRWWSLYFPYFMTYHRIFNMSNATHLTSLLVISRVGVVKYSVVPVVFRGSFVFLPFFLVIVFSVSLDQGYEKIRLIRSLKIFIWETGYCTRAMKRFALFDLVKSLYSDTKILSKYIPSLQKRL